MIARALLVLAALAVATPAAAGRYAVIVGANLGDRDEAALRHAESDAEKVFAVLRDVGGFSAADMVLLVGEPVDQVRAALAAMNARVRADADATLVVYYSGHADEGALHLDGAHWPTHELTDLVAGSAARFRILVVDACRSGALTRRKGGAPDAPITIDARSPVGAEGFVILTASSAGEDAQESDALRGSFFTHHWVSGLRGAADLDGDGDVSLDESYRHAFTHTVRQSSATLAGTQHPTFRFDVSGAGSVVLTRPASARRGGALELPSGLAFLVFDEDAEGRVVAELPAETRARALRVNAGTYFVRGRGADALYEGTVTVAAHERRAVELGALERIDYARLVRKGGGERAASHLLRAGYAGRSSLHATHEDAALCHGAAIGYSLALRYLSVDANARGCLTGYENRYLRADEREGAIDVGLSAAVDVPFVSLGAGGFIGAALIQQSFTTPGLAPTRLTAAPTLGLRVGAQAPLPLGLVLGADLEGTTYLFQRQLDDTASRDAELEAQLVVRASAWLGWQF